MDIKEAIQNVYPDMVTLRRSIHEEPEVGMETKKTCEKIAQVLEKENISYRLTSKNGIIADIVGKKEDSKHIVLLRADLDALNLTEDTGLPYTSKVEGKMHACGHDIHSSMLVGTAIVLNQMKDSFSGTVRCIFSLHSTFTSSETSRAGRSSSGQRQIVRWSHSL